MSKEDILVMIDALTDENMREEAISYLTRQAPNFTQEDVFRLFEVLPSSEIRRDFRAVSTLLLTVLIWHRSDHISSLTDVLSVIYCAMTSSGNVVELYIENPMDAELCNYDSDAYTETISNAKRICLSTHNIFEICATEINSLRQLIKDGTEAIHNGAKIDINEWYFRAITTAEKWSLP